MSKPTHYLGYSHTKTEQGETVGYGIVCQDDTAGTMQLIFSLSLHADTSLKSCILRGRIFAPMPQGAFMRPVLDVAKGLYLRSMESKVQVQENMPGFDGINMQDMKLISITQAEAEQLEALVKLGLVTHGLLRAGR